MSQFVVSARKYRPTTFDEVVGQNHVAKTLKNALQTDHLAHAFLFCGPRGVGKTTCARILAKVINCQNTEDKVTPCNECSSCKSFSDNASFNIFELDAASNNSVEHIRNLNEQVRFQPQQGTHKVFIIDEVHMLSTQAFNAFLKTLEEPPPYAIFILATTEKHKILPTILSRCQIFDFKRIQPDDIVKQLKHIGTSENREAEEEALHQIALKADGAMRDALSIYDKVASASQDKITYQDVVINLNLLDYDYFFKVIDATLKSDLTSVLLILDDVIKNGFEADQFVQGLAGHLRDLLVSQDPKTIHLMEGSNELKKRYYNQSQAAKASFLLSGLNLLNNCDLSLPRANNKRLQVEIALTKLCYLPQIKQQEIFSDSVEKKTLEPTELKPNTPVLLKEPEIQITSLPPQAEKKEVAIVSEPIMDKQTEVLVEAETEQIEKISPDVVRVVENEAVTEEISSTLEIKEDKVEEPATSPSEVVKEIPPQEAIKIQNEEIKRIDPKDVNDLDIPLATGSAGSSLDKIKQQIKEEEAIKKAAQNNLSIENIQTFWDAFINNHTSNSFQAGMRNTVLELDNKHLTVWAPSPIVQGLVIQENALIDGVRDEFGSPDLTLEVIINKDKFPAYEEEERVKTYYSRIEAYEELVKKNPVLLDLIKSFELKNDERT